MLNIRNYLKYEIQFVTGHGCIGGKFITLSQGQGMKRLKNKLCLIGRVHGVADGDDAAAVGDDIEAIGDVLGDVEDILDDVEALRDVGGPRQPKRDIYSIQYNIV